MPSLFQPKVEPLPQGINLSGKTVVVTGASAGLGLEVVRQLLILKASTVVLAVRSTSKGEACRQELLSNTSILGANPKPNAVVMELDMERYESVIAFTKQYKQKFNRLDLLLLNAGLGNYNYFKSPSGHERTLQVNYLSNVLLFFELLPALEATAVSSQARPRVTWVGSRMQYSTSFAKRPFSECESIFQRMDDPKSYPPVQQYGDTKLLCNMFMDTVLAKLGNTRVLFNMLCPGMIATGMADDQPLFIRLIYRPIQALNARRVEEGGWLIMHSAVVAEAETHGRFLIDKTIAPPFAFVSTAAGQRIQKKLWNETIHEISSFTSLPAAILASV